MINNNNNNVNPRSLLIALSGRDGPSFASDYRAGCQIKKTTT